MSVPAKNSAKERDKRTAGGRRGGRAAAPWRSCTCGYHRRLARFLSRFTPRYENVEEIINDTFMVVWQSAKDFRNASQVSTWIIGIAYRTALKSFRRQKNHTGARSLEDYPEQTVDPDVRRGSAGLVEARPESSADRAATDLGTRLSHGAFVGGNRGDHRLPGRHGQGAHVSCAREIAPIPACLGRRGSDRRRESDDARARTENSAEHQEISALLPWYVNATLEERERAARGRTRRPVCASVAMTWRQRALDSCERHDAPSRRSITCRWPRSNGCRRVSMACRVRSRRICRHPAVPAHSPRPRDAVAADGWRRRLP